MNNIRKIYGLVAAATLVVLCFPSGTFAQLQTNSDGSIDGFIRNQWIEAGFNYNGSFGSYFAAPDGYHPKLGTTPPSTYGTGTDRYKTLGFVADPNETGWTDYYGDFFLPSTPYEGFSVRIEIDPAKNTGSGLTSSYLKTYRNDRDTKYKIPGVIANPGLEYDESRPHEIKWTGTAAWTSGTESGDVKVINTHTIVEKRIENNVKITNNSNVVMTVYVARSVDPDNAAPKGSGHSTTNKIESQGEGAAGKVVWVSAAAVDNSSVSYYTRQSENAKVGIATSFGNIVDNPQNLWATTAPSGWIIGEGLGNSADHEIGIAFKIEDLQPGETREVNYDIILDQVPVVKFAGSTSMSQNEGTTFNFELQRLFQLEMEVTATVSLTKISSGITVDDFVGLDVIPKEYTFVFAAGETSKTFSLQTAYDQLTEGNETFRLDITKIESDLGGVIGTPKYVQCTIIDLPLPVPSFTISPSPIDENSSTSASIKINLDRLPMTEIGGDFIADLVIGGTATVDTDYTLTSGANVVANGSGGYRVTIPVGQSSANLSLLPVEDKLLEGDETATFTLTIVQGGRLTSGASLQGNLTITDKTDGTVIVEKIEPLAGDAMENPLTHGAFRIGFKDPLVTCTKNVIVEYLVDGSSDVDVDHTISPSETTAKIIAGNNDVLIPITVIHNYIVQGDHDISLKIDSVRTE